MASYSNPYASYIANLNSTSPVESPTSPEDLSDDLSLWSTAQFTFDIPPGMGIYEDDLENNVASASDGNGESQASQQPPASFDGFDYLNVTPEETPRVPLLERSRQRNPAPMNQQLQPQQVINAFNTIMATITAQQGLAANPIALASATPLQVPQFAPIIPAVSNTSPRIIQKGSGKPSQLLYPSKPTTTSSTGGQETSPSPPPTPHSRNQPQKSASATVDDPELAAKLAAEEDKRRRNTAASARFRVKKKQREQALERTAREMTTKAEVLEGRVRELEMEIKWLRGLIVEKDSRLLDIAQNPAALSKAVASSATVASTSGSSTSMSTTSNEVSSEATEERATKRTKVDNSDAQTSKDA